MVIVSIFTPKTIYNGPIAKGSECFDMSSIFDNYSWKLNEGFE